MGKFVKGDVVVINFPFSDLTGSKRRPALVLSDCGDDDIILCQITGQLKADKYSVHLTHDDYIDGNLRVESIIRPNKLFTADKSVILYSACKIAPAKMDSVIASVVALFTRE